MCSSDNYSDMSDFEINKLVAALCLDEWYDNGICVVRCDDEDRNIFNPCNSWADAGPIIEREKIQLFCEHEVWDCRGYSASHKPVDYAHSNPLRAAMIVFLMMQEVKGDTKCL